MKIHRNLVTPQKSVPFDEDIDFSYLDFKRFYPILNVSETHVVGEFYKDDDENLAVYMKLHSRVTVSDSRTLEPFDLLYDYEDEFALLRNPEEDAEGYLFEENNIELSEVAWCSLHSHIPLCPHQEGSPLPSSGEGYQVYEEGENE